jgi:hypothetical protein
MLLRIIVHLPEGSENALQPPARIVQAQMGGEAEDQREGAMGV